MEEHVQKDEKYSDQCKRRLREEKDDVSDDGGYRCVTTEA